jgi:hypothetical protein
MPSKQILMGGNSAPYRYGLRYYRAFAFSTNYYSLIQEPTIKHYIPVDGTITGMSVILDTAPGTGNSWPIVLRKNGVDTAIAVTISGSDKTGNSNAPVSVVKGDYITLRINPTSSPDASAIKWALDFTPTVEGSEILVANNVYALGQTDTVYNRILGSEAGATWVTGETTRRCVVGAAGRIKTMIIGINAAPLAGCSRIFTVFKNGVATALEVTIADADTYGEDLVNYVDVVVGDELSLRSIPVNTPNAAAQESYSFEFVPTTPFETPMVAASTTNNLTPGSNNFASINYSGSWSLTETGLDVGGRPGKIRRIYAKLGAAPGAGKSWTFALRINGVTSALAVTISEGDTSGYADVDTDIAEYDKLVVIATSSGGPAATTAMVALAQYYSATSNGSADLAAEFIIRYGIADLHSDFVVRQFASTNLQAGFQVAQGNEDLQSEFEVRQSTLIELLTHFVIEKSSSQNLQCGFKVQHYSDLWASFNVHKTYDFSGALGIGFYWWGSEIIEGDQIVDFQLLTPTGGWIAKFPDGDAEWRWILLPFEDRDPTSNQRLIEVDLGGSRANKAEVESFLWTYYSKGVRRVAYVIIWYGGDLQAGFKVRQATSATLQCALTVRKSASTALQCGFTVRQGGSAQLLGALNVNP